MKQSDHNIHLSHGYLAHTNALSLKLHENLSHTLNFKKNQTNAFMTQFLTTYFGQIMALILTLRN